MKKTMLTLLGASVLGALGPATSAHAVDPYMWGVGVNLGTTVIPGQYPASWPTKIANYNFLDETDPLGGAEDGEFKNRDIDENGDPLFTSLVKARTDLRFTVEGFYYLDKFNRIGGYTGLGTAKHFSDAYFLITYDRILAPGTIDLLAGGGIGVGTMSWKSAEELDEKLRVSYYPLRARVAGQARFDQFAASLGAFVQVPLPSRHVYQDRAGEEQDVGSAISSFLYVSAGVELGVHFGDFTPPKKNKGKKNKGKNKGKKGGKAKSATDGKSTGGKSANGGKGASGGKSSGGTKAGGKKK